MISNNDKASIIEHWSNWIALGCLGRLYKYTAISIYVVGSKPQAYKTRPKGNMGS